MKQHYKVALTALLVSFFVPVYSMKMIFSAQKHAYAKIAPDNKTLVVLKNPLCNKIAQSGYLYDMSKRQVITKSVKGMSPTGKYVKLSSWEIYDTEIKKNIACVVSSIHDIYFSDKARYIYSWPYNRAFELATNKEIILSDGLLQEFNTRNDFCVCPLTFNKSYLKVIDFTMRKVLQKLNVVGIDSERGSYLLKHRLGELSLETIQDGKTVWSVLSRRSRQHAYFGDTYVVYADVVYDLKTGSAIKNLNEKRPWKEPKEQFMQATADGNYLVTKKGKKILFRPLRNLNCSMKTVTAQHFIRYVGLDGKKILGRYPYLVVGQAPKRRRKYNYKKASVALYTNPLICHKLMQSNKHYKYDSLCFENVRCLFKK